MSSPNYLSSPMSSPQAARNHAVADPFVLSESQAPKAAEGTSLVLQQPDIIEEKEQVYRKQRSGTFPPRMFRGDWRPRQPGQAFTPTALPDSISTQIKAGLDPPASAQLKPLHLSKRPQLHRSSTAPGTLSPESRDVEDRKACRKSVREYLNPGSRPPSLDSSHPAPTSTEKESGIPAERIRAGSVTQIKDLMAPMHLSQIPSSTLSASSTLVDASAPQRSPSSAAPSLPSPEHKMPLPRAQDAMAYHLPRQPASSDQLYNPALGLQPRPVSSSPSNTSVVRPNTPLLPSLRTDIKPRASRSIKAAIKPPPIPLRSPARRLSIRTQPKTPILHRTHSSATLSPHPSPTSKLNELSSHLYGVQAELQRLRDRAIIQLSEVEGAIDTGDVENTQRLIERYREEVEEPLGELAARRFGR